MHVLLGYQGGDMAGDIKPSDCWLVSVVSFTMAVCTGRLPELVCLFLRFLHLHFCFFVITGVITGAQHWPVPCTLSFPGIRINYSRHRLS